jgi:glycosyltransferase involved in cell wall biosynthesis
MVNDKKSVASVIAYTITKAELGGAQRHVYDLIESLHHEYEIHLIVGSLGWLTDKCQELGVSVHHLPTLTRSINMLLDLLAVKEFVNLIRQIKPDIIHAHSGKPGLIARLAGAIYKTPVIFTAHGWGFDPNAPKLRRNAVFVVEKLLTPLAAKIICVCESDRQLAIKLKVVNRDRVVTIHNGIRYVDALLSTPAANPPQLIMVARFNKQQKDQHTLMKAIKILNEEIKVLFIGTGPDWEETKNIAQDLNVLSRVSFLGDRLDVETLLSKSQIFVLVSHYEGLPISILEAMRAGLPVIATRVNGIPEQVVDGVTGLLVPHEDVNALVEAITTLIKDPDMRRRMGSEGAKKLTKEFTLEQMVAKTKLVYQSIIQSN